MIRENLNLIRQQIREYCVLGKRREDSVLLLAVSKNKPAHDIAEAYRAGQRHFGESYCQEALKKQTELGVYDITWHFIGPIQSNKTKLIAAHFDWVHSVDSLKNAKRLHDQRPAGLPPLNICLQVNISGEGSKSGISLEELPVLCEQVAALARLRLRGVMAIPAPESDLERQRQPYRALCTTVKQLARPELDTFSFGMTGDLKAAVLEGATIVRVGTALFGARTTRSD
ncbi:YggS family pyridoxal phosphate-dependent enzyme [Methylomicrobium sp. Wu6]|uniref:YggS family pyridoxal phosphate-dependent enzyme n=1 Tax=Methylomicrobium sp. Wu6 TaxID=3107928 RepID=UPI002DD6194E|nr:YggS family pyridoxal phosphate-dependent enzyme [Methylomicrobium sp. Wu6]MEC4748039.1 YggS family pyridoxal phosphate-dependent enzyme [Methylomicrobium sp. Wu6]